MLSQISLRIDTNTAGAGEKGYLLMLFFLSQSSKQKEGT